MIVGGPPAGILTGQGDGHRLAEVQAFITAVENNQDPPVTGGDGLRAVQVAEAAARSLADGRALHWDGRQYAPGEARP